MKMQRKIFPPQSESKGDSASNSTVKFSGEVTATAIEMASIFLRHKAILHLPKMHRAHCH